MKKNVSVLFSAGLDSTYLIWKNLKDGNYVNPYYINIENNNNKSTLELNRIKLLVDLFKEEFPNQISDCSVGIKILINNFDTNLRYSQLPIWILSVLFFSKTKTDEFQIGYVCGDDMVSYIDDIQKIYKSYNNILDKRVKLTFPIIKMNKFELIEELPKKYFNLTITCEEPVIDIKTLESKIIEFTPCCKCHPCKRIISDHLFEYSDTYSKPYTNVISNKLLQSANYLDDILLMDILNEYINRPSRYETTPEPFIPYQLELPFEYSPNKINSIIELGYNEENDYICKSNY